MSDDPDDKEEAKEKSKKTPATKPEPLKELPAWIPAIAGFTPVAGSGKHWIDESGKEIGTMAGTMIGAPRDAAKSFAETMRPRFAGVTTNDVTVNGNLTMTVFVSDGKAEDEEHKIEFELKPIADRKSSRATLTYTQPAMPEKNRSDDN